LALSGVGIKVLPATAEGQKELADALANKARFWFESVSRMIDLLLAADIEGGSNALKKSADSIFAEAVETSVRY
jgi:hypothetical protein